MKNWLIALFILHFSGVFAQTGASTSRPLFDKKSLSEIRLTFSQNNWADALDSLRLYGDNMLQGTVSIDGVTYNQIGARFRGNNSYQMGMKRNPMHLKLNLVNKNQQHQGYTSIKLSSALRDPSMVREMLYSEIAAKYIPTPQTCYAKLYVNNEYIGVFVILESVDGQFYKNNFGSDNGASFKAGVDYKPDMAPGCKQNLFGSLEYEEWIKCYSGNFEMGSAEGWEELQDLTKVLNKDVKNIEKVLDVDNALWMLALNNVLVNLNSYSGNYSVNYYLFRDNNGKFHTIPWDLNLSFGSYKNIGKGSDLDLKGLQRLDPLLHSDNPYKPLISQLLKDPYYKKVYLSHIRQILEDNIENNWYEKRAQELQGMIVVAYSEDKNRYYSLDDFQNSVKQTVGKRSKIPGLTELMQKRQKFLKNHPELTALPSEIKDINVQGRGKFENQKVNMFKISAKADRFPKKMMLFYRLDHAQPYQMVHMTEETGDMPAGVKAFMASIESRSETDVLEYYIIAENAGTVAYSPKNYTAKPLMVKLSELNK